MSDETVPGLRCPPMRTGRIVTLGLLPLLFAACATGQRPRFSDDPFPPGQPTGEQAVDSVLTELDGVSTTPHTFTAHYDILTKYGEAKHSAIVTVDGSSRSVQIDDVHYIDVPGGTQTCIGQTCSTGLNAAAISNTQLTIDFYGASAARRLRVDANAKIGPSVSRAVTIAAQPATCVDIAQANNTAVYCALTGGGLAKLDDADVAVTLTSYAATADAQAFVTHAPTSP